MNLRKLAVASVLFATAALVACGERVEAGLANAPSLERKSEPRQNYDVIASGDEGCVSRDGGATVESATGGCRSTLGASATGDGGARQLLH